MMRSLWSAATGMKGQEMNIDVISNNLSNVTTTGYKKNRVDFQDLLYQTIKEPGAPISTGNSYPVGIQLGHGVRPGNCEAWRKSRSTHSERRLF